jgi:hypothetical protein
MMIQVIYVSNVEVLGDRVMYVLVLGNPEQFLLLHYVLSRTAVEIMNMKKGWMVALLQRILSFEIC